MIVNIRQLGFTLVEMVMTIVLLGIIAGVLVPFITQATNAYVDTSARSELTARGRLALERLAKEIRHVVPNTVQELGGGIGVEFVTSKVGGRYMSRKDAFSPGVYQNNRRFRKNANLSNLYILGTEYDTPLATDVLVIYNESPATIGARSVGLDGTAPASDEDGANNPDGTPNEVQLLTFDAANQWDVEPDMQHYQIADFCHEVGQTGQALYWRRVTGIGCIDNASSWLIADPVWFRQTH